MQRRIVLLSAAVACAVAAGSPSAPARAAPEGAEEALPGVSLDDLTEAQREVVAAFAREEYCYCGCPHTVAGCLRSHKECKHAPRMVRLAARYARAGAARAEIARLLDQYYASFDRRARLETASYGPPLGDPAAPVTIVEFSDFACPFCAQLRPVLERFVEERAGRVKLVYKPFPIDAHPGAFEAALAAEWARGQGIFWKFHDALYANARDFSPGALASLARGLGADGDALQAALESGALQGRVQASRQEARAAGLRATPTLFFDGRLLVLPDLNEATLDLTLED
ncbi:MAG TPA: thioredoxin domain-containing protein, partial [Anaeromyxobacteraceae bacterium]|nr:thioredoxin domain-containing protein [Anaeromyxobacteraceae bacterium]